MGAVRCPSLSVVSSGTRQPFKNRLSRLNQAMRSTNFRQIVSSYRANNALKVSSVNVAVSESSSVALQSRT